MVEDAARTVHLALLLGEPDLIPDEEVARAHRRYVERYGQDPSKSRRGSHPPRDNK
jgi:L-ribulose-5-phosphate 4-epimerase